MSEESGCRVFRRVKGIAAVLLVASLSGCEILGAVSCTTQFVYGITVTVVDGETGADVTEGLSGVAIRGSTSSDMEVFGNMLYGAGEQSGRFAVVVSASGYDLWTRDGIVVTEDECHVVPVSLEARLVRTTPGS